MRSRNPRIQAEVRAEAIEWLITFSEKEVNAEALRRFNEWLRTSPEHVATYLRVAAFWQDADRIEPKHRRDIERLVRDASAESNVYSFEPRLAPRRDADRPLRSLSRPALAATALLLGVAILAVLWDTYFKTPTYVTNIGELRTITLEDGSVVTLNASSRIRLSFTRTERLVELTDGQALFRVTKDPARPFIVQSNEAKVTAVGTQFDVNRKSSGTVVTVLEGRVSVTGSAAEPTSPSRLNSPMLVSAGEQAIVTPVQASKHRESQPANVAAWTTGLLVFDSEPLREVARAFNRQNAKQLIITDPELQELRISGVFPAAGAGPIAKFLRERFGVHVVETDAAIRIEKPQG
jgi:transmembrane sensor